MAKLEVEVKIPVDCSELSSMKERLKELGAKLEGPIREEDIYFNHPCRDLIASDEAIRIRYASNSTGVRIAYKGPRRSGAGVKARREIEEEAGPRIREILEALGFNEALRVVKERVYASLPNVLITLDKVEGLGCFVEVESRRGLEEDVKEAVRVLGLEGRPFITESYASMLASDRLALRDPDGP